MDRSRICSLLLITSGAFLGYVAAQQDFTGSPTADAAASPRKKPAPQARELEFCSEGANKSLLLARADVNATSAGARQATTGRKPNIVVIMGDDVGIWFNIGAYHRGMMAGTTPRTSTSWPPRGCCSPTITPRRAARPDVPTSSPGNCRSARE